MSKISINIQADKKTRRYYSIISRRVSEQYALAKEARAGGKDVCNEVESTPTIDLADRCEKIVGPEGVAERYRQIYKEMNLNRDAAVFKLFREIIEQQWIKIPDRDRRLEQAVKTALVLVTEGVVVAPLDGVPSVRISKNLDGSEYVDIYFAGPIRAAGGTAQVFPLILGDYARKLMGLDRYKPTEDEIERYVEETQIYDEIVTRQYKLSDEEVRIIVRGCPVCINGEPTEEREVTVHKDLERISSDRVRGGMCLVLSEGIAQKAMKILTYARMLELDWNWLEQIIKVGKKTEEGTSIEPNSKYLTRIAAGRPIFSYPSNKFGFRLRYGRARNTGIMGKGIHPATMYLLGEFIAVGTQLKIERPGKSAEMLPVDSIDGPIVKLLDGEVKKINSVEEVKKLRNRVSEILFLGDYLCSVADFRKTAHPLVPVGYCEEWWALELRNALGKKSKLAGIDTTSILNTPSNIDCFTAVELSMQLGIALHPKFLHYYSNLSPKETTELVKAARNARKEFEGGKIVAAEMPLEAKTKELLEKIGLPHKLNGQNIIIDREFAYPFLKTMGALSAERTINEGQPIEILSRLSGIEIRDKGGTFVGTRMGRPEASRPRKMVGNPSVLFPIGLAGGSTRSINKAAEKKAGSSEGEVEVEVATFLCQKCRKTIMQPFCTSCKERAQKVNNCPKCGAITIEKKCMRCNTATIPFERRKINVKQILEDALQELRVKKPEIVKGVKGLMNSDKVAEPLEKGILRARHDLHIFRDATIRYELLNAPLTHVKAAELGLTARKLRELGYENDFIGKPLENEEQLVELFPQDIIVNEQAGEFMVKVTKFVDELLERFYGMEPYYRINSKEELIGELVLGLAPHTSAAIVGRIIGFTKARVNFAHPFFHLCKRRNADGDQDSIMLLMDCLLNFSQSYLPSTRGGRMDAPLVFTVALKPTEIDDEAYEIETCMAYPLELYEKSREIIPPQIDSIARVQDKLGTEEQYSGIGFTHHTTRFDNGPSFSTYVQLETMEEKIKTQAKLQGMIRAVDNRDALERVLVSHFLPDIIGNARAFSRQTFRCSNCNTKYRRIPLCGRCTKCGEGNIILTIAQGSVRKYLEIAKEIIAAYGLSSYLRQRIELIEQEVNSIFVNDHAEQKKLMEFV